MICGNSSSNPIDKWLTLSISHVGLYKNLTSSNNGFSEFNNYSGTGAYFELTMYIYSWLPNDLFLRWRIADGYDGIYFVLNDLII